MSFSILNHPQAPEVHASTLLIHKDQLLSAWFGGTKEGHPDTKIWFSTRDLVAGDAAWEPPRVVASRNGVAHWNPVLFHVAEMDRIMLFFKVGSPISSWWTRVQETRDGGRTWSKARELVPGDRGGRGPVKNKCIALSNGTIIAPASLETPDGVWQCFTDSSSDQGEMWQRSESVPIDRSKILGEGAIQPSLLEVAPGKLSMLTRSSTGFVLRADSENNGMSWGDMYETTLFNNNSGLDALRLEDGRWVVVHNPVNRNWGPRTPLVISVSEDEGNTWRQAVVLEEKLPPTGFDRILALDTGIVNDGKSEFSYPAIISDEKGGIYVSYTYERVGIKHVHVQVSELARDVST